MAIINETHATIDTTATDPKALQLGQLVVSADRRSTSKQKLTDAERIRRVVLPAGAFGSYTASIEGNPDAANPLTGILTRALVDIASERLRAVLATDPGAKTVPLADFTASALLAWNAENAATSSAGYTRKDIEEWFPTSSLHAVMAARDKEAGNAANEGFVAFVSNRLGCSPQKNHGFKTEQDCDKMLTLLAADLEPKAADGTAQEPHELVGLLVARIEAIRSSFAHRKEAPAKKQITMDAL